MSPITQIRARIKKVAQKLSAAKRRHTKADAACRKAAGVLHVAREEVQSIEAEQTKLAQILKLEEGVPTTKIKPGPKPRAIKAAGVKTHKKPGPKPKAERNQSRAAQGRREVASGVRKPIKDVIAKVLGKRVMNAQQVYLAIKEKGALPNSGDPRAYIGYLLSASKVVIKRGGKEVEVPLFERVHEKGRGFYKNQGVSVSKAAAKAEPKPAKAEPKAAKKAAAKPAKAAPVKDGKRTVTCSKCGKTGHNAKGHDRANAKTEPKAAKPTKGETKKAAAKEPKAVKPAKAAKKTSTCKTCGLPGHNARGHAKFVAKADAGKTNGTTHAAKPAPVKVEGAKAEKRQNKCGKCGALGHNAKGHDKAMAAAAPKTNGTTTHAKPEPKDEVEEKVETKPAKAEKVDKVLDNLTTDELLKEAGVDLPAAVSPS